MKNNGIYTIAWIARAASPGGPGAFFLGCLAGLLLLSVAGLFREGFFSRSAAGIARGSARGLPNGAAPEAGRRLGIISAAAQLVALFGFFLASFGFASPALGSLFCFTGLFLFLLCSFNLLSWHLQGKGASRKENGFLVLLGLASFLAARISGRPVNIFAAAALAFALLFALFHQYRYRGGQKKPGISYIYLSVCILLTGLSLFGGGLLSVLFWTSSWFMWNYLSIKGLYEANPASSFAATGTAAVPAETAAAVPADTAVGPDATASATAGTAAVPADTAV
ncbi:MAG: hypothetical protein LBI85_07000, partial [Spirochaetaceae bacterium]|nr:hypothetical protein [Spirochaetaceae bacterium]